MICPEELATLAFTMALAISKNSTTEELEMIAAVLTQIADTILTIIVQRGIVEANSEKNENIRE